MRCSNCSNADLVTIRLTISDEDVALYRCPRCDVRTWSGPHGEISKDSVLDLVRSSV